jgi:hypothetical protein
VIRVKETFPSKLHTRIISQGGLILGWDLNAGVKTGLTGGFTDGAQAVGVSVFRLFGGLPTAFSTAVHPSDLRQALSSGIEECPWKFDVYMTMQKKTTLFS